MGNILEIKPDKISWHLVWIFAFMEGITVLFLPYFSDISSMGQISKSPSLGFILGYIGMLAILLLVNTFSNTFLKNIFTEGQIKIKRPFISSFWGAIFLSLIFTFQLVFRALPNMLFITFFKAIFSISSSTLLTLFVYNYLRQMVPWLSIAVVIGQDNYKFLGISVLPTVILISLYEAMALPIIELFKNFQNYKWQSGLILGILAGASAIALVILCYNYLSNKTQGFKVIIQLEK